MLPSGISYDKPLPPIQVASQRAERIAKEKKVRLLSPGDGPLAVAPPAIVIAEALSHSYRLHGPHRPTVYDAASP